MCVSTVKSSTKQGEILTSIVKVDEIVDVAPSAYITTYVTNVRLKSGVNYSRKILIVYFYVSR